MKIAVFCSANKNIDPDFFTLTEEMGKWMAENGHDLVFGGCNSGLMDCIGKAVKANGGRTIGVVPTLVERGGRTFPDLDIEIPCDNLSDRKDLMLAQSDIFVALPGGIGTLDGAPCEGIPAQRRRPHHRIPSQNGDSLQHERLLELHHRPIG